MNVISFLVAIVAASLLLELSLPPRPQETEPVVAFLLRSFCLACFLAVLVMRGVL
jgi:hypothetical protein